MTRLDKNLATLATMSPTQLRENWNESCAGTAPAVPAQLLRRLLAQQLQERRHGHLPPLVVRELERARAQRSGAVIAASGSKRIELTPGTRLIRQWNGQTISVEVREDGFLWENRRYRSLSEIAREVTGAHWSGPRFFGLIRRG